MLERRHGTEWRESRFLPKIGPVALYGLLFTIVVLFALQGEQITEHPSMSPGRCRCLAYFALMWSTPFALGYRLRFPYERNASVAFTASANF